MYIEWNNKSYESSVSLVLWHNSYPLFTDDTKPWRHLLFNMWLPRYNGSVTMSTLSEDNQVGVMYINTIVCLKKYYSRKFHCIINHNVKYYIHLFYTIKT